MFGFVVGCAYDLFLTTPLATTGLAYALCAWVVGLTQGAIARRTRVLTALTGFVGGLLSGTIFVVAAILAGADELQTPSVVTVVLRAAAYDALLAPLAFALVTLLRGRRTPVYV